MSLRFSIKSDQKWGGNEAVFRVDFGHLTSFLTIKYVKKGAYTGICKYL